MKKLHLLICAIVLSVLILGVGGGLLIDAVTPKVGLCLAGTDEEYGLMLQEALEKVGCTVLVADGENDRQIQIEKAQALLSKGADLLVVQLVDTADAAQYLSLAGDTPVLFVDDAPESLDEGYFVGFDREQLGAMQAALVERYFVKSDINGDKRVNYLLLSGMEKEDYASGFQKAAAQYNATKLEQLVYDKTVDGAKLLCKQAFSKYGRDIEVILCDSSKAAQGAVAAIEELGRIPGRDVVVFGTGTEKQCAEAVLTGVVTAAIVKDQTALCNALTRVVEELLGDKDVPQITYVDHKIFTQENIDP